MDQPDEKILTREAAAARAQELRARGNRIVTVNGSFDLLHAGHLVILEEAKAQGDVLFVGVNSDASVKQYKSAERPIVQQEHRVHMLCALSCVDYVVLLDVMEAGAEIVRLVQPHVHVNGSEYGPPEQWVEYPVLLELRVTPYMCQRRPALATSDIIRKIQGLPPG